VPEGDTIFRAARTLQRALAGKTVRRFESALAGLAAVDDQSPVAGRTIEEVSSRGKHLLMRFSGDLTLRTHMRMNGSWHIYRTGEAWRLSRRDMRMVIETDDFVAVGFNIPVAEFLTADQLRRQNDLRLIGPDLLGAEFDEVEVLQRMRARAERPVAEILLNQRVLAGIGNVYKSELLFLAGIFPFAPVGAIDEESLKTVMTLGRKLLAANVLDSSSAAIITYSGFRRTTRRSDPADRLWVYGRRGKPCRNCGTEIDYRKTGVDARSTYWCPACQVIGRG